LSIFGIFSFMAGWRLDYKGAALGPVKLGLWGWLHAFIAPKK
jgi:hypothetical protein